MVGPGSCLVRRTVNGQPCDGPGTYFCDDERWGSACRREQERRAAGPEQETAAEALARRFHETYERLAPDFGYRTREASAVPWAKVPEPNRALMVAVCAELLKEG